jgi:transcriptional regulator with XRE-family HTH domain
MPNTLRTRRHRALISVLVDTRKASGLTQRDLSVRLKINQSVIAQIEAGQRRVDVIEFMDIAKALDTTANHLLEQISLR